MKQIIFLLFLLSCTAVYAQQQDSVTIHGRVTDYNGQPIDSASVWWQNPQFNDIIEAITDKDGHYTARIPKGKYQSAASIYLPSYAHIAMKSGLPETEHRLEFWAWDFIADRDTTLDIRYHRMEAYGLRAFRIPGAMPTYQIYVRPMSLTRTYQWMKETKPESLVHGENLSDIEQQEQNRHHGADDRPVHLRKIHTLPGKEAICQGEVFLRRAICYGAQAVELARPAIALRQAENDIGVAYINGQQHSVHRLTSSYRWR